MKTKKVKCTCGCGKYYVPNDDLPVEYELLGITDSTIGSVKRLSDGVIFSIGDTIKRITKTGKLYESFIVDLIREFCDLIIILGI